MHLEVFVEERSAEEALSGLLPKLLPPETTYRFHAHQGKPDLLRKLPVRLAALARYVRPDWRVVVLVDEDGEGLRDPRALDERGRWKGLKDQLEDAAREAHLVSKTAAAGADFTVLNRIAVEEIEAWFIGDMAAVLRAYPRVPQGLERKAAYRDPDAIRGGTWEALERILKKAGYYPTGMPKAEVASRIAPHMDPDENSSCSFRFFVEGVRALCSQ